MAESWHEHHGDSSGPLPVPYSNPNTAPERVVNGRGMPVGTGLGKYRILDRIRTMEHAIVYSARDAMLDRLVVIKQLNPALLDDPLACGDFKHEAQLLARVPKDARNVIGIHELIGDDQGLFIVEECVAGEWLETLISKRKVALADALRLLKYGCLGLRALHSRKIIHRAIQPSNLLISPNGQVRIGNFSCASHEGDHTPPPFIASKYAAPELQAGLPHDDRVDIYALGITVYEVCVGRRALHEHFSAITRDLAAANERWRQWHCDSGLMLPPANALHPSVPPALASILHRMTAKDLDERFASVDEVLQEIVRRFGAQRSNAAPLLPNASRANLLEARPAPIDAAPPAKAAQSPRSLLHLAGDSRTTRTELISVAAPVAAGATSTSAEPESSRHPTSPRRRLVVAPALHPTPAPPAGRPRTIATPSRPLATTRSVPPPCPASEAPRKHRGILVPLAAALILVASLSVGGMVLWQRHFTSPQSQTLSRLLDEGLALYKSEDYRKAREKFLQVQVAAYADPNLVPELNRAETLVLVVDGQLALEKNDFTQVRQLIHDAGVRGTEAEVLGSLRDKYYATKEAVRLADEGIRAIETGKFVEAQSHLSDYAANAKSAGLDPERLSDRVKQEKDDRDYDKALTRARKALADDDFEGATLACRDAQIIRVTTATRQLRQDIADAKARFDWMVRGDKAMKERDYVAAEAAYQSANAVDPSDEVELKLRIASSRKLYQEARDFIGAGDLLAAKKKLENALWKYPNRQARAKMLGLARAFDAAQLVESADEEVRRGNAADAIRLYEKAIPDLIEPAKESASAKLKAARRGAGLSTGG